MMKKLLGIVVLGLFLSGSAYAKVKSEWLSIIYNNCTEADFPHKYCKCTVETINNKMSNRDFEKMWVNEQWKIKDWMAENVEPVCNHLDN